VVVVQRDTLAIDLRTFGEDDLADRVPALGDADLARIWERADHYVYSDEHALKSGGSMLIGKALALAAVDVLEGASRDLRWKRRRLKGIYPGY
jgi:hypothetical protein